MFTVFIKSAVCIYSKPGLLTLLTLLFITKQTATVKVSWSLLSFKWDQLHKHYFCGIQRFILNSHFIFHIMCRCLKVAGIQEMCIVYFSYVALKQFPL